MSFAAVVQRLRTLTNPYPGLRPFETSESHLFFGRDQQVAELVGRLERNRFLAIVGVSGSGKSSLVRAGLIPALERGRVLEAGQRWRVVVTRPGAAPLESLAGDLRRAGLDPLPLTESSRGLIAVARQLEPDESLLVVVDQFEELFRYKDSSMATEDGRRRRGLSADAAAEFVQLLLAAGHDARPVYIVITMRSDYLGDCAEFRDLPETLNDCQYLVPRMTREQRKQAIEVPLGQVAIAPSLVQRLLNDAGDEPDQLPVLQHALMRTWNHWRRGDPDQTRRIELEDYTAIGGFSNAIDQHAEEVYAGVDPEIAETIFKRLTARGRGNRERRDPATLDELCAICGATTPDGRARVLAVIDSFRLGDATFLAPRDGTPAGSDYIDITHESLIRQWRRLRHTWLIEEQQSAKRFLSLVERARDWRAEKAKPLFDLDFAEATQWDRQRNTTAAWAEHYAEANDLELLQQFLAASKSYDRRQRLRKRGLWVVVPLAVVFAALSVVAVYQTRQAQLARGVSVARLMAAKSQLLQSELVNLEPSVLLAIEALRRFPSADTERALRQAVARLPRHVAAVQISQVAGGDRIRSIAVSRDDRAVAVVTALNVVKTFDVGTWQETSTLTSPFPVAAIVPGSPGTWTLVTAAPTGLSVRTLPGGKEIRSLPVRAPPTAIALSRNGVHLVTIGDTTTVHDVTTGRGVTLPPARSPSALAISSSGRLVAIGANESRVTLPDFRLHVLDAASGRQLADIPFTSKVSSLAFGDDERLLVSASDDGTLRVFDLESGVEPARINTEVKPLAVVLSPDARVVSTGNSDGTVRVYDLASGVELARLAHEWHEATRTPETEQGPGILAVTMSHNGRLVVSGGEDGKLRVFQSGGVDDVSRITEALPVTAMAFANGGRRLVIGSGHLEAARVGVFDGPDWRETIALTPPNPEVRSVAVSANGRFVGIASNWAGGPWVYDLEDPQKRAAALGGQSLMSAVALSGDGAWVGWLASSQLQLLDRPGGKPLELPRFGMTQAIALSDDGRTAIIGTGDIEGGAAVILKLPGGTESGRIAVTGPALFVAISADGRWAAAAGKAQNAVVHLIDTAAKRVIWRHTGIINSPVAFSPDGSVVALVSADGTLRTFATATGDEITKLLLRHPISALAFEDQGRSLIAASATPTISSTSGVTVTRYPLRRDDLVADACARVTRDLTELEWTQYVGTDVPRKATCAK